MADRDENGFVAGWAERIAEAQLLTHYTLCRIPYARIPADGDSRCRSCGVQPGQLHVPSCSIERCPICGGQQIGCGCRDDLPGENGDEEFA